MVALFTFHSRPRTILDLGNQQRRILINVKLCASALSDRSGYSLLLKNFYWIYSPSYFDNQFDVLNGMHIQGIQETKVFTETVTFVDCFKMTKKLDRTGFS